MKHWFTFVGLLLCCVTGTAQGGKGAAIRGIVKDEQGPLSFITVVLQNTRQVFQSDKNGRFICNDLDTGMVTIHLSGVGYQHLVRTYRLQKGVLLDTILMKPSVGQLEDVVVSGTMRPVSKLDSPIPVEVYSPALFRKNPAPNIFENLHMVNGVQPQLNCSVCNTGDIHINGMEGPYTMILIDGMPIVSSLSTVYGLAGIPSGMVKRIEVVKGPASTLYGSEAMGGVINIITKDPSSANTLKADVSATSVGEYNADLNTSISAGKSSALLGINYFNYWNRRDINHDNFTDVTLQNRFSVFNKWKIARNNGRTFNIAGRYVYENRWGGEMQWTPSYRGSDQVYGESIYTNRLELIGNYELATGLFADFSYNYHHQDSYYGTVAYNAIQHVSFGQLRFNRRWGRHEVLMGLPFRYTWYDDNSPGTAKPGGINKPSISSLPGIFVQDEWKVSDQLTTLAGLRYDRNSVHGNIFTPRLSFKYAPSKQHVIRLTGGTGYRVVNLFTEEHAALTGAREVVVTETLQPEQSWNVNLNYAGKLRFQRTNASFDFSLFYTRFSNKIIGDFLTDPQKIIYANLPGYAVSKGITINTDFDFGTNLKVNAGATFMEVYQAEKDAMGKEQKLPQLFAPSFSGTFAVSYIFRGGLSIDWTGRVNGPMHLPVVPNDYRPSTSPLYCLMNLQITKTFQNGWELYGGVKNLLNFLPKYAILHPDDPFDRKGGRYFDDAGNPRPDTNPNGYTFDPSYMFAPMQGAKAFLGLRLSIQ